jgi:hypothetical protein
MRQWPWIDVAWFLLLFACSACWCVLGAGEIGPTFDEPIYIEKGVERIHTGKIGGLMKLGTMPLPVDVQMFPVRVFEWWRGQAFDGVADLQELLPLARAANLLFWGVLLLYVMLAARSLAGPWAGRLAVLLLALEPTFLAHASLATTDVSVAACVLAFAYHFWQGRDEGWVWRVGVPGLWLGLAALAKASGPVFAVLCMFAIELQRRWGFRPRERGALPPRSWFVRDFFQIALLGAAVTFLYCGSDRQPQPDALRWAEKQPEGWSRYAALTVVHTARIFPTAADGFIRQVTHNARGHGAYLLGFSSPSAIWWYFPVAVTIKFTVPLLLLAAAVSLFARRQMGNAALAAAGALLLFSFACRVQIGVRFMLPLVALAIAGLSAAIVRAIEEAPQLRPVWAVGLTMALVWCGLSAWSAWPDGLGYINELYGGRKGGEWAVSDSNLDWGQGVPELQQWAADEDVSKVALWYYGADPAAAQPPFEPVRLHEGEVDANFRALEGRWLAVSACLVWGPPLSPEVVKVRERLAGMKPAARTRTFVLYYFPRGEVARR